MCIFFVSNLIIIMLSKHVCRWTDKQSIKGNLMCVFVASIPPVSNKEPVNFKNDKEIKNYIYIYIYNS